MTERPVPQATPDGAKITREEMREMFGDEIPAEAIGLIWDAPPERTIGEVRAALRKLAREKHMAVQQTAITATNSYDAEMVARRADPQLDRAMDAFWKAFHTEGPDLWRCVHAAIKEAAHGR